MPGFEIEAAKEGFQSVEEEAVGDGQVRVGMVGFGPGTVQRRRPARAAASFL